MAQNVGNLSFALGLDLNPLKQSMTEADAMLNRLKDNFAKVGGVTDNRYGAAVGGMAGKNQLTQDYKSSISSLKTAWDSIDWNKPKEAQAAVFGIATAYRDVQKNIGDAGLTLEQFTRKQDKSMAEIKKKADKEEQDRFKNKLFWLDKKAMEEKRVLENEIREAEKADQRKFAFRKRMLDLRAREEAKAPLSIDDAMAMPDKTIVDRTEKLKQLNRVRDNLSKSDLNYDSTLRRLNSSMQSLNRENQKAITTGIQLTNQADKLNTAWGWAMRKAALYFSVGMINNFLTKLKDVRGEFELQQKSLAAIIQNKEAADKIFAQTVQLALMSPFRLKELVGFTRELSAYRIETEKLFDTTKMLADISAGLGVDMGRLILAYGQVRSASVLRGQELRQFTEAGIPIIAELANEFGKLENRVVKTGEVFEKISRREVPFAMVDKIFKKMTSEGGTFFEMQAIQAETLKGKWSNLLDAYDVMLNNIGKNNEDSIKAGVEGARALTENYRAVIFTMKVVIAASVSLKTAMWAVNLATQKYSASMVVGTGALKKFAGEQYGAIMAAKAGQGIFTGMSKSMTLFTKATVAASAAATALKAVLISTGIMVVVSGVTALVASWVNSIEKAKEFAKGIDEQNMALLSNGEKVNKHIDELKALTQNTDENIDVNKRRLEILEELRKADGRVADQVSDSVDNMKRLTEVQGEYNRAQEFQLFLNNQVLKSADGTSESVINGLNKLRNAQLKQKAAILDVNNAWSANKKYMEEIVSTGKYLGENVSKSIVDGMKKVLASSGDSKSKLLSSDYFLGQLGIPKKTDRVEALTEANKDVEDALEEARRQHGRYIDDLANYVADKYPEIIGGNIDDKQVNESVKEVTRILDEAFGDKKYTVEILTQWKVPQWRAIPTEMEGWRAKFQSIAGADKPSVSKLVGNEEMVLLDALEDIQKSYADINTELEKEAKLKGKEGAASSAYIKSKEAERDALLSILKYYNQDPSKEETKKQNKDAKTRVELLQEQAEMYKQASEAYKKYLTYMDAEAAKARVLNDFKDKKGFTLDAVTSQASLASSISNVIRTLRNMNTDVAQDAADKLENELRSSSIEFEVKASAESKERLIRDLKNSLEDFNLRVELEGLTGISGLVDMTAMPDATEMMNKYTSAISELKRRGGEEDMKQAKELEEEFNKWLIGRKTNALKEISQLVEQNSTREQKMDAIRAKVALEEQKVNILNNIEATGLVVLTEQQKIDRTLSNARINSWQTELVSLEEMALKATGVFQQLFGDIGDLTMTELKVLVQRAKDITSDAVIDGEKVKVKFTELDGSIVETTITLENYLSVLNKTADIERDIAKSQPFKQAEVFFKKGGDYAKNAANGRKELRGMKQELEGLAKGSAAYDAMLKKINEKAEDIRVNNEKSGESYTKAVELTANGLRSMSNFVGMIGEVMQSLGASEEVVNNIKDIQMGLTVVISLLELVAATMAIVQASSGVIGWISLAIAAIAGAIVSLVNQQKRAIDRMIKEQEVQLERLTRKYDQFAKERDKAASSRTLRQYTSEMVSNLKYQEYAISRMIMAERSRRNQDEEALRDLTNQLEDVRIKQKEVFDDYIEELRGTNLKSASEEFADTWIEAFLQGENAMDAFQTKFSEMIQTMLVKQAALRVMGNILEPFFQSIDNALGDDGELSQTELSRIMGEIPAYIKMLESTSKAILEPLMETVGLTAGSQAQAASGLQAGIEAIQEDTAQQLVALLNTMRYQMYASAERSIEMSENVDLMARNSVEMLIVQGEIRNLIKQMREWQDSITSIGHNKGGKGLKVFSD